MTDYALNQFVSSGTAAQRAAFTPSPATPAVGNSPTYFWLERDTGNSYAWNFAGAAWIQVNAIPQNFAFPGDISPAQIVANTNDYAPTGLSTATVLRLTTDASRNLTGLTGGADGRVVIIANVGSFNLVLKDEDAGSSAANRFALTADITITPDTVVTLLYDSTSTRWRSVGAGTSGSGTVTLITAGAGLSGGAITTSGTIAVNHTITPQGRLSLVSATAVMTSDQTAKTTIYCVEYCGNRASVWDGTNMVPLTFSNLSCILDTSNHLLENVYDIYMYDSGSSTAALGASPAWINTATVTWTSASPGVCSWTSHGLYEGAPVIFTAGTSTPTGITAGTTYYVSKTGLTANAFSVSTTVANAEAGTNVNTSSTGVGTQTGTNHTTKRGTGAGTTELELKNGLWVNKNAIPLFNNSVSSGSIAADKCTYLGSIYCIADGQTGAAFTPAAASGGPATAPVLGIYNAYNRTDVEVRAQDSKTTWTPATTGWRAMDQSVKNRIYWLDGLQQSTARVNCNVSANGQTGAAAIGMGIGINTSSVNPSFSGIQVSSAAANLSVDMTSPPLLGVNYAQAMEYSVGGVGLTMSGNPTGALITQQLLLRVSN